MNFTQSLQDELDNKNLDKLNNQAKNYVISGYAWLSGVQKKADQLYFCYIPSKLRTVRVRKQSTVPIADFIGCNMLTNITYSRGISSRGNYAFQNCSATVR